MMSPTSNTQQTINVMLVDDSSVIRGALTRLLEEDSSIKIIASVTNGELAISSAKRNQPDIVILDVEMPVMDGITALPEILKVSPKSKIIMFSTLTAKGADITLKALSLGAIECLVKPSSGAATKGGEFHNTLTRLIKNLCPAQLRKETKATPQTTINTVSTSVAPKSANLKNFCLRKISTDYTGKPSVLAIGSSTGGPQALFTVLKSCNDFNIPIVITQHMPATFTKILAQHITQQTGIDTKEGEEGMVLEDGKAYVAPGGFHMLIKQEGLKKVIRLDEGPPVNFCKPAVDPMFDSLINIYGNKMLGVILTGMGHDGLQGGKNLTAQGGRLIAQDEESSVVWGMPGAVAMAGICSEVLPINDIGPWIKKQVIG